MSSFVPEEDLFPTDALGEEVLLDAIADNIADVTAEYVPTKYDVLFEHLDSYEQNG